MTSKEGEIAERRLRHVCEFLDNGNNKKALQEVEKVIKKHQNLLAAKAVKALALIRLDRVCEAEEILRLLFTEQPSDEFCLQMIAHSCKDLNDPNRACRFYENAVKKQPQNEELMVQLFISYARVRNYKLQQQIALQLYKVKQKVPYYFWAVMTSVIQSLHSDPKLKQTVLLPLAERMIRKLDSEGKLDADPEIELFILLLEMQGKYDEAINFLSDVNYGGKLHHIWNKDRRIIANKIRLKHWPEVILRCKGNLRDGMDDWFYFASLVDSTVNLLVHQFSGGNLEDRLQLTSIDAMEQCALTLRCLLSADSKPSLKRASMLALLRLSDAIYSHNNSATNGMTLEMPTVLEDMGGRSAVIIQYLSTFLSHQCCYVDLRQHLWQLGNSEKDKLSESLKHTINEQQFSSLDIQNRCRVNKVLIELSLMQPLSVQQIDLHIKYLLNRDADGATEVNVDAITLSAVLLFDVYVQSGSVHSLLEAAALCEQFAQQHPYAFYLKLLLVKIYGELGASEVLLNVLQRMDIKYVQHDTLSDLIFDKLSPFGRYDDLLRWCNTLTSFHEHSEKELFDAEIQCYRSGGFVKMIEVSEFSVKLKHSFTRSAVVIEQLYIGLMDNCSNFATMKNSLDSFSVGSSVNEWLDTRDFSVYDKWDYRPDALLAKEREESFKLIVDYICVHKGILDFFVAINCSNDEVLLTECEAEISKAYAKFTDHARISTQTRIISPSDVWLNYLAKGDYLSSLFLLIEIVRKFYAKTGKMPNASFAQAQQNIADGAELQFPSSFDQLQSKLVEKCKSAHLASSNGVNSGISYDRNGADDNYVPKGNASEHILDVRFNICRYSYSFQSLSLSVALLTLFCCTSKAPAAPIVAKDDKRGKQPATTTVSATQWPLTRVTFKPYAELLSRSVHEIQSLLAKDFQAFESASSSYLSLLSDADVHYAETNQKVLESYKSSYVELVSRYERVALSIKSLLHLLE